ncbi:flavodoxin [Oribacterium sp. FC2011]|uniref:flavodoxin n=1 Tax=Oribacterium sp. FC2011 TaxID=1408311 RepID=UPI0004E0DDD0|nr:flavodoxin [Oribacterium sp. FC2011]
MSNCFKKITVLIAIAALMTGIVGCGNQSETHTESVTETVETVESVRTDESATSEAATENSTDISKEASNVDVGNKTLVVYFSATGTTKGVAEKISQVTEADLYKIVPKEPYTDADLNYNDSNTRATKEQRDPDVRPEFEDLNIEIGDTYSTVFIGYPIWWGEEPRIMDTFVESYDFDGLTIIPFCTSGGSGISTSSKNLSEKAGSGNWLDGNRFSGDVSLEEIRSWIDGLSLE